MTSLYRRGGPRREIPSITVPGPPCAHVPFADAVYRPVYEMRPDDVAFECPCCGAVAYAAAAEELGPCPYCDEQPRELAAS